MITQPIYGTFKCPLGPIAKPIPSCPIRTPGWMMTPFPMIACMSVAPAPMWQSLPTTTLKPNHGTSRYRHRYELPGQRRHRVR